MSGVRVCAGHFGYPLDDTYIHMAMAKNFAKHQVWGITRYGFTSSTSSPLFTLLLGACYGLTGVREITPFVLNAAAAIALLIWCDFVLSRAISGQRMNLAARAAVLCLLVLAVPLPTLVHVGMEHVLHTLLTLVFAYLCCARLAADEPPRSAWFLGLLPLTALLVTARYEGVFLVGAAGLLFLLRGWLMEAAGLAIAAAAPLGAYGWISMMHGWYPIPSSLLLKANVPSVSSSGLFGSFSATLFTNLTQGAHVAALILLSLSLLYLRYRESRTIWSYSQTGLILFAGSAVLHLCFARVGWFFRYESYLIAFGIIVCAIAIQELNFTAVGGMRALIYLPAVLFAIAISYRSLHAAYRTPQAISDIYCQQYQMGLFARDNFAGKAIVIADIGAVSFLSDAKVLDLVGLGSLEALQARLNKTYSTDFVQSWSRRENAVAALTAVSPLPPGWTLLTTWTIPNNYVSGSDHVGIYAIDPATAPALEAMLVRFRARIPARVIQRQLFASTPAIGPVRETAEWANARGGSH